MSVHVMLIHHSYSRHFTIPVESSTATVGLQFKLLQCYIRYMVNLTTGL